jgi:hypothetical protein
MLEPEEERTFQSGFILLHPSTFADTLAEIFVLFFVVKCRIRAARVSPTTTGGGLASSFRPKPTSFDR